MKQIQGAPSLHDDASPMGLRDIVGVLHRRRGIIVQALAIGLGLGIASSLGMRPMYRAATVVTSDKTPPAIVLDQPNLVGNALIGVAGEDGAGLATLAMLATSDTVRTYALEHLVPVLDERTARAALKRLRVQPMRNTDLLRITADSTSPQVATEAANAVAQGLVNVDLAARRQRATELRQSIQLQLASVDPKLRASERALAVFKIQHGDVPLTEQTVMSLNKLAQLETQQIDVRVQKQEADARIQAAGGRLGQQVRMTPTQWVPSPLIRSLQTDLASQKIELSGLQSEFTPMYPKIVSIEAKIAETQHRLDNALSQSMQVDQYGIDPVYQQLVQQVRQDEITSAALAARDKVLSAAIEQYGRQMRDLPVQALTQARLTRDMREAEDVHQVLAQKLQQALVAEASVGSSIRVVDPAALPPAPLRSRWFTTVLGVLLGLVVGVGGAFVQERLEDPVQSAEDVRRFVPLPVLGTIPRLETGDRHPGLSVSSSYTMVPVWRLVPGLRPLTFSLPASTARRGAFAEAFRYLRTNLLYQGMSSLRTILVTSPGPGEGAETVAANLAIALAQVGQRVWLVDCNLRNSSLPQAWVFRDFERDAHVGLADVLVEDIPVERLLHRSSIENLSFLPPGISLPNPAELLGSQAMRRFLEQERSEVETMVLCAPPVLPVADAAILASSVDGVILAVEVGMTPREAVSRAFNQLQAVGARILGVVTTGVPFSGLHCYYSRYYGADRFDGWYYGDAARSVKEVRLLPVPRDSGSLGESQAASPRL